MRTTSTDKDNYNEESFYYRPYSGKRRNRTYQPFGNVNYDDTVREIQQLIPKVPILESLSTLKKAWEKYESLAETNSGQGIQDMRQRFQLEHPRLFEIINKENFNQYKVNVKTQIIEGGLLTDADRIDKILRAYSLLEVLAPAYIELFYQTYPAEAALLTDKLMLFGRYSPKVSLQRGFRDQEMGHSRVVSTE
ncbi:MAG: hypothetical protein ACFB0B_17385 [Thermonemataceae bacterium]